MNDGSIIVPAGFILPAVNAAQLVLQAAPNAHAEVFMCRVTNYSAGAITVTISLRPFGGGLNLAQWLVAFNHPLAVAESYNFATREAPWGMSPNSSIDMFASAVNVAACTIAYQLFA